MLDVKEHMLGLDSGGVVCPPLGVIAFPKRLCKISSQKTGSSHNQAQKIIFEQRKILVGSAEAELLID